MLGIRGGIVPVIAVLALCAGAPAAAQENLDQGKSAAQLFASDCAICHKTTNGLSKAGGVFGLKEFLREHYTASKESAAALAAYVAATDKGSPAAKRKDDGKRKPKGEAKAKADDKKADNKVEKKLRSGKSTTAKSSDAKAGEGKPGAASGTGNSTDAKPKSEPSEKKASKPVENKGSDGQPDAKSDDKKKSD